jgi:hypothetical protein
LFIDLQSLLNMALYFIAEQPVGGNNQLMKQIKTKMRTIKI